MGLKILGVHSEQCGALAYQAEYACTVNLRERQSATHTDAAVRQSRSRHTVIQVTNRTMQVAQSQVGGARSTYGLLLAAVLCCSGCLL